MNKGKILVVDDDFGTLKLIELTLNNKKFECTICSNARDALRSFDMQEYDAVLSDYYMPEMDGLKLLQEIRLKDKDIPFIVLTSNNDIETAIQLMQEGADDYITKPIVKDILILRLTRAIETVRQKLNIKQIEEEKRLIALENKRLTDWRTLYAFKDTRQSDMLIELFHRTINESGGFSWLDMFKKELKVIDDNNYSINANVKDLIIQTTERHRRFFDNIAYIATMSSISLEIEKKSFVTFSRELIEYITESLQPIAKKYDRAIIIQEQIHFLEAFLSSNFEYIRKIIKELIINAIKYSAENSTIFVMFEKKSDITKGNFIDLIVKNTPRIMNTRASDFDRMLGHDSTSIQGHDIEVDDGFVLFGDDPDEEDNTEEIVIANSVVERFDSVSGIPYEYSELVFDLFYTIEPFPVEIDEEEWRGGTGLYISRRVLTRLNGLIRNANGIDYSLGESTPFVQFTVSLPYTKD